MNKIVVTSAEDTIDDGTTLVTLREALEIAKGTAGADEIEFDIEDGSFFGTLFIDAPLVIASGEEITIDGTQAGGNDIELELYYSGINVDEGAALTLRDLNLSGFEYSYSAYTYTPPAADGADGVSPGDVGGDGADGAAGAAGPNAGLVRNFGALTLDMVTVDDVNLGASSGEYAGQGGRGGRGADASGFVPGESGSDGGHGGDGGTGGDGGHAGAILNYSGATLDLQDVTFGDLFLAAGSGGRGGRGGGFGQGGYGYPGADFDGVDGDPGMGGMGGYGGSTAAVVNFGTVTGASITGDGFGAGTTTSLYNGGDGGRSGDDAGYSSTGYGASGPSGNAVSGILNLDGGTGGVAALYDGRISISAYNSAVNEGTASYALYTGYNGDLGGYSGRQFGAQITRTGQLDVAVSVTWGVEGTGTSPANGQDFGTGVLPGGTVVLDAWSSYVGVNLSTLPDSIFEGDETFDIVITNITVLGEDGQFSGEGERVSMTILDDDASGSGNQPVVGQPVILGTPAVGETLTVDLSDVADADGISDRQNIVWYAGETQIRGLTGQDSIIVTEDMAGLELRVAFTFEDNNGTIEFAFSDALPAIPVPANAVLVDTEFDIIDDTDGLTSLREAIAEVESSADKTTVVFRRDVEEIDFDQSLVIASGADITISGDIGDDQVRLDFDSSESQLVVEGGANITLSDLEIAGRNSVGYGYGGYGSYRADSGTDGAYDAGQAGGRGQDGAAGDAGTDAAIIDNSGLLTLDDVLINGVYAWAGSGERGQAGGNGGRGSDGYEVAPGAGGDGGNGGDGGDAGHAAGILNRETGVLDIVEASFSRGDFNAQTGGQGGSGGEAGSGGFSYADGVSDGPSGAQGSHGDGGAGGSAAHIVNFGSVTGDLLIGDGFSVALAEDLQNGGNGGSYGAGSGADGASGQRKDGILDLGAGTSNVAQVYDGRLSVNLYNASVNEETESTYFGINLYSEGVGFGGYNIGARVELEGARDTAVQFTWEVVGSGANPVSAGDFALGVLPSGEEIMSVGSQSTYIDLGRLLADEVFEGDETFDLVITGISPVDPSVTLAGVGESATFTVFDDDADTGNQAATGKPVISGTAAVGETLTMDLDGVSDADGISGNTALGWLANGTALLHLRGQTEIEVTPELVGMEITAVYTFEDGAGHFEALFSDATAPVAVPDDIVLVDTKLDIVDGNDGKTSLREAVAEMQADSSIAAIEFRADLDEVLLANPLEISGAAPVVIDGDIDGDGASDVSLLLPQLSATGVGINVNEGADLTLRSLSLGGLDTYLGAAADGYTAYRGAYGLSGTYSEDGSASDGGDGGDGLTGRGGNDATPIVNSGTLRIEDSIIENFGLSGDWGIYGQNGGQGGQGGGTYSGTAGDGGDGGTGGTGGDGGHAAPILNLATGDLTISNVLFENIWVDGGNGGRGGRGGEGGRPGYAYGTDGVDGTGGTDGNAGDGGNAGFGATGALNYGTLTVDGAVGDGFLSGSPSYQSYYNAVTRGGEGGYNYHEGQAGTDGADGQNVAGFLDLGGGESSLQNIAERKVGWGNYNNTFVYESTVFPGYYDDVGRGSFSVEFELMQQSYSSEPIEVTWELRPVSDGVTGDDFIGGVLPSGTVMVDFNGEVGFAINPDWLNEGDEEFDLVITSARTATGDPVFIQDDTLRITIRDDDGGSTNVAAAGTPTVTGTPALGETLVMDASALNDANGLGAFEFIWLVNGDIVRGLENDQELVITEEMIGKKIMPAVWFVDGDDNVEVRFANPLPVVQGGAGDVVVDTALDIVDATDGLTSLREAVADLSNTRVFFTQEAERSYLTDTLTIQSGQDIALIGDPTSWDPNVSLRAAGEDYHFATIESGGSLKLTNISISDFDGQGENGADGADATDGVDGSDGTEGSAGNLNGTDGQAGGNGENGEGGADGGDAASVFINNGDLVLERVVMSDNRVIAGEGGDGGDGSRGGYGGTGGTGAAGGIGENGGDGGNGGAGGSGGDGAAGGNTGDAALIINTGTLTMIDTVLRNNEATSSQGGAGGYGGTGGHGGAGGAGGYTSQDQTSYYSSPLYSGNGGVGGRGGDAGAGGDRGDQGLVVAGVLNTGTVLTQGVGFDGYGFGYNYARTNGGSAGNAGYGGSAGRPGNNGNFALQGDYGDYGNSGNYAEYGANGEYSVRVTGIQTLENGATAGTETGEAVVFLVAQNGLTIQEGTGGSTFIDATIGRLGNSFGYFNSYGDYGAGSFGSYATVDWEVRSVTTTAADFGGSVLASGTVGLGGERDRERVEIEIEADALVEMDEQFELVITQVNSFGEDRTVAGTSRLEFTIVDDDEAGGPAPDPDNQTTLTIFDALAVAEGDTGDANTMTFTVRRGGDLSDGLDVDWDATGIVDAGSLRFDPFEVVKTITITIPGDEVQEPDQPVEVRLSNPSSGAAVTIIDAIGRGTVLDDDAEISPPPPPSGPVARVWGDPHLVSLDGLGYSFQAVGEFVLVEATAGDPLMVQIRTEPVSDIVSAISVMATKMGSSEVEIGPDGLKVNGVATPLDEGGVETLSNGDGQVFYINDVYTLVFANGEQVVVGSPESGFLSVAVLLGEDRAAGSVQGLLGNADGDTDNDLALRDGTALTQPVAFDTLYGPYADSWRISEAEALFARAGAETTADFQDASYPKGQLTLSDLPTDLLAAATAAVDAAGITDAQQRDAAILDFALTGQFDVIQTAVGDAGATSTVQASIAPALTSSEIVYVSAVDTVIEGAAGTTTPVTVTLERVADSLGSTTIDWSISGTVGGADLASPLSGTVNFESDATITSFDVLIAGDNVLEPDEDMIISISSSDQDVIIGRSSTTVVILNDEPVVTTPVNVAPTGAVTISGTGTVGARLTALTSTIIDDNGLGDFAYQWFADGQALTGATGAELTLSADQAGADITVTVSYTDGEGFAEQLTSAVVEVALEEPDVDAPSGPTSGDDTLVGTSGVDTIDGLGGNDVITGLGGADVLRGGAGRDNLNGNGGNDKLFGGGGNDTLKGAGGKDNLIGGGGNDKLIGGGGDDKLNGGGGKDNLNGGGGKDNLIGGGGNDKLTGGGGNDTLKGGGGKDNLKGGGGNDKLIGGGGNDNLNGGGGKDNLKGGGGKDVLKGGGGADRIDGGGGNDKLTGNGGKDVFVFKAGKDTITDYKSNDSIDLKGAAGRADLPSVAEVVDGDLVLTFSNKNILTIEGITSLDDLNIV